MPQNYPELRRHLRELTAKMSRQSPAVMSAVAQLHKAAMSEGALEVKQKELIALGIGIAVHCDGCIAFHTHEALAAGATREQIIECIGVAMQMGGGPSVVYGTQALEALDQFSPPEGATG